MAEIELSYCVVNTAQRELLVRGLKAIALEALPEQATFTHLG